MIFVDKYKINNTTEISRKILNYMITKSYHKIQKNSRKIANLRYIKGKQAGRTYHTQHKVQPHAPASNLYIINKQQHGKQQTNKRQKPREKNEEKTQAMQ
jgi:hypothetical protein